VSRGAAPMVLAAALATRTPKARAPRTDVPVVSQADYLAAHLADVRSRASVLSALREVLSTPAGQSRDWNRLRALFAPWGVLTRTVHRGSVEYRETTAIDALIEQSVQAVPRAGPPAAEPTDAIRKEQQPHGAQLLHDGSRWWILSACWAVERPDALIPRGLLERN
jgi:hypothetical protein